MKNTCQNFCLIIGMHYFSNHCNFKTVLECLRLWPRYWLRLLSVCKIWQLHWNFKYFTKLQSKIDEMFPFQFWWQSQSKQRIKGTAVTSKSASSMMLCSSFYQNTILLISLLSPLFPFCLFVLPRTCDQEYLQRISKPIMEQPKKNCFY